MGQRKECVTVCTAHFLHCLPAGTKDRPGLAHTDQEPRYAVKLAKVFCVHVCVCLCVWV